MLLNEFSNLYAQYSANNKQQTDEPRKSGFYREEDDKTSKDNSQTRTSRLTLEHLNKIRKMRDVRNYEMYKRLQNVKRQYGKKSDSDL
jgi:hypothetical protein